MPIHLWGTDFRRSSSELRQALYIPLEERPEKLGKLRFGQQGLIYLHTCNRIEFYTTAENPFQDSREFWIETLKSLGLDEDTFYQGYHLEGKSAVRHLIRVASSLESMVVGEPQILGQLKEAKNWSVSHGLCAQRGPLARAFQTAFETAKKVRTETKIGDKPVSIATIAANKVEQFSTQAPVEKVVLVGRSPMIVSIKRWLSKSHPTATIKWVNRSIEKLDSLEDASGVEKQSLEHFIQSPGSFSHLFTATGAQEIVFDSDFLARTPDQSVFVDLAEPHDIERSENIRLIQIEDLNKDARANQTFRSKAIERANVLVESALRKFYLDQKEAPVLREFSAVEPVLFDELEQSIERMKETLDPSLIPGLEKWAQGLVKRNLHLSREFLKTVLRGLSKADAEKDKKIKVA